MNTYFYATVDETGRVTSQGFMNAPSWPFGRGYIQLPAPLQDIARTWSFDGKTVTDVGQPPSEHRFYDPKQRAWVLDAVSAERAARSRRNDLLTHTDWVVLRAADQGEPMPPEWMAYRQALRDVTEQPGFPEGVVWPTPPDA